MGRIRILSDNVANKIAAGEVVERPASVVKELLENSLDAGATDIRIEIESGGRRLIRITDNGCGMLRDDAMLAFERHATSKLSDVNDLLSIATLGFRGEALPSIASVSRLVLETRTAQETTGTTVELAGGKLLRCEESALASGTAITVRDLFFNVPARRKFLRSEQTELAHIASLVTHYSLAHPSKSFQLMNGASELLGVTPVEHLRDRVYQVFGAKVLEDLVDLGYKERELTLGVSAEDPDPVTRVFAVRGFVSSPQVQKMNRNSVFLFVNGRLIRDRLLMHALSSAYHNLMPAACYPFALLFLDCDCEEVDVNVHPSKTEVRFRHGSFVHDFIRDSIRDLLMMSRPVSNLPLAAMAQPAADLPFSDFTQRIENHQGNEYAVMPPPPREHDLPVMTLAPPPAPSPRFDFGAEPIRMQENTAPMRLAVPDTHGAFPVDGAEAPMQSLHSLMDLRPLGQIHDSFIIAAGRDGLWIIDQHVAHERILFEKVLKQRATGRVEMQQLLMPIVLQVTAGQQLQYARIADELNAIGFDTEPFGTRTIAVKAAPSSVSAGEIEKLISEILEIGEGEMRSLSMEDLRRGIAASIACRAAIKINTRLDQTKMDWLLTALSATDYPMSCPHGRPIALRYPIKDILKGFHRI
jgi:DNA mismatch repair protein MutL